jgi:hypothetical protein
MSSRLKRDSERSSRFLFQGLQFLLIITHEGSSVGSSVRCLYITQVTNHGEQVRGGEGFEMNGQA